MKKITLPSTIGNTPIVKIPISVNSNVEIFAKLESFNLTGSIKDRTGYYMFMNALEKGRLDKKKIIIESSSGNTALSLAAMAALYGYKFTAFVGKNILPEREKLIKYYGANIVKTEIGKNVEAVRNLIMYHGSKYQLLDQYKNKANVMAHYYSTAKEIIKDVPDITHIVAGLGTGGTLIGLSLGLKEYNSKIKIVAVEPNQEVYVPGLRNIKSFKPEIYMESLIDLHLMLSDQSVSFELIKELGFNYGIPAGPSSGAALWGALQVAKHIKKGKILVIFPDGIEKYINQIA